MFNRDPIWKLRNIYAFLKSKGIQINGSKIGPTEHGLFNYNDYALALYSQHNKPSALYRIIITCKCGRHLSYGKMDQHLPYCGGG